MPEGSTAPFFLHETPCKENMSVVPKCQSKHQFFLVKSSKTGILDHYDENSASYSIKILNDYGDS